MATLTDSTLTKAGVPADAAATGERFAQLENGVLDAVIVKTEGMTTITLDTGNGTNVVITIKTDEIDTPLTISVNGVEYPITWEGS